MEFCQARIPNTGIDKSKIDRILENPILKAFASGSCSGIICTTLLQPLDVIKTRLQNPVLSLTSHSTGTKIIPIITDVIKHEQISGLWKGTTPALMRSVPGIGLYFCCLEYVKTRFFNKKTPSPSESIFIGVIARSMAGATLMPMTVVKTRFESGVYQYSGVMVALQDIFHHEGIKGLTRGLVPTIFRDAPYAGIYFMFYNQTKSAVPKDIYSMYPSPVHFTCALVSSTLASLVTQPPDVFKTQLQLYPNKYNGLWSVVVHIYLRYGILGYFQGIVPRLMRRTLVAAISWTLYEKVMTRKSI
ncbi:mitochondrial glycine transporter B-like [Diorhabda carinulata]|uniref:mitochondrial glycine transporter B-like n=1 Tax=Diorhabda carinulata TaxID=1163345 RepID=UPI0025A03084|nr:mitochondrial glycine transporter B-like [Diorhabda carinulata]XP_057660992.1 mitochondrial glycine transporter B-like [Diorhabda carinulata]